VTPALALAERIAARGDEVLVFGAQSGLETRLVPEAGFELVTLPSRQIMGRSRIAQILSLLATARACVSAALALRRAGTEIVVSVGGYASLPAALAAVAMRRPLAIVEPNAIPGRANRLVARFAAQVFAGFEEGARRLAGSVDAKRVHTVGVPLRAGLVRAFAGAPARRAPAPPCRVLVFGGSQGAHQINEAMAEVAADLPADRVEVFHQAGAADRARVAAAYAEAGVRACVVDFEPDMPRRYAWADLAVCRAGALTVAELAMAGLPALLVPYPYAADDHQRANAEALARAGAGCLLGSRPLDPGELGRTLGELLEKPARLAAMSEAAYGLARPDAADRIVEECAALLAPGG
jgi:UDP-N-acetylglucosamine--N-acetylmuramyl-(pentapeptide) pyrophosphoryl-undecaprenol N-acetylglucosamine transferase